MLLGFPLHYRNNKNIQIAIASFGRVLLWKNDRVYLVRVLVKARFTNLHEVPQFIVITEAKGFEGQSWTMQCETLE
jgi:hypothetical protein